MGGCGRCSPRSARRSTSSAARSPGCSRRTARGGWRRSSSRCCRRCRSPDAAMADAIAEEQAALRRVATLVASGAAPGEIFHAVAEEAGRLLGARSSATIRYDGDVALTVGRWREESAQAGGGCEVGPGVPLAGSDGLTAVVFRTGRPARIDDYAGVRGHAAEMMRKNGYRAAVPAPIVVGGHTWGLLLVASAAAGGLGAGAELRLAGFAWLVPAGLGGAGGA